MVKAGTCDTRASVLFAAEYLQANPETDKNEHVSA